MPRPFGVEEELLVVAERSAAAVPGGDRVVGQAEHDGVAVEREFKKQQVEIGSAPGTSAQELRADLAARRTAALRSAEQVGARLAALATHPLPVRPAPTDDDRYDRMAVAFGLLAREQLTCGQHVHVEIGDRHEGVDAINRITPWLSVLVALSANSPYWQGEDTGFASYRTMVWGLWPTAGPLQGLSGPQEYDDLVAALVESGAALDPGMMYFDARLSAHYPTVEIRVCDVSTDLDVAVLMAVLCRGLVETAVRERRAGLVDRPVRPELLRAATFRAARSGLTGELVHATSGRTGPAAEVVRRLRDHLAPVLAEQDELDLVDRQLGRLLATGDGAAHQRAVGAGGDLTAVVEDAVSRTRPFVE